MNGVINVLKPPGMSSHQVVSFVRKVLHMRKVGHTGTLDPGAAGVLPICVGKATRIAPYIVDQDKTYIAEMTLGIATRSQDASGESTDIDFDLSVNPDQLGRVLASFIGMQDQIPPMASAIRVNGQRLYQLERKGITVKREPRKVIIKEIHVNKIWPEESKLSFGSRIIFSVRCSKGTYIRTLCHDIGEKLGTVSHMSFLVRSETGLFQLKDAITLEELQARVEQDDYSFLVKIEDVLQNFTRVIVSPLVEKMVLNGNFISITDLIDVPTQLIVGDQILMFSLNGQLLALGEIKMNDTLICQPFRVLKEVNAH